MIYLNTEVPSQSNTAQCGWVIGEQLERMWKELVVAYLETLFVHLPEGSEENNKNWAG